MRHKITLSYVGTAYAGWQRQPHDPTVQGVLEAALAGVAGQRVAVTGAGRTDSGVHASGQVAHFDSAAGLLPAQWRAALNANLPADVRVLEVTPVSHKFHARYSVTGKLYRYCIDNRPLASPFLAPFAWHLDRRLDVDAMQAAARLLEGPVDQRAFATRPQPGRSQRPLERVQIDADRLLAITFQGRSFLRYAVRGMVGTLVQVGTGRRDPESLAQLAASGDRAAAGPTAPAHGLCLVRVDYGPGEQAVVEV